jgi:ubiquinone/menaquinone biosynthesis C-methylase UbiE
MAAVGDDGVADWEQIAAGWERGRRLLWEATRPVSEWLVERLQPVPGETVAELAAGTGETGFLAARRLQPGGRLISSDRSPSMLESARRVAAELGVDNVEFRVLETTRIDLADASLDGVLSRFGYVLKGDPPAALAEVRRVLRRGGRFAFAVWAARERNSWMTVPADAMVAQGQLPPPGERELRLSQRRNPQGIASLLEQAGFQAIEIEELPVCYRFADAEALWLFASEQRGPLSVALGALGQRGRLAVRAEIEQRAGRSAEGGYELTGVAIAVIAS